MNIKRTTKILLPLLTLVLLFRGFFISDAYAYLDPATGTMILQMLVGVFVGLGITLKVYWHKIKEKFVRN